MEEKIIRLALNRPRGEIHITEDYLDKIIIELPDGTELPLKMYLKQELVTILEEALKEANNE